MHFIHGLQHILLAIASAAPLGGWAAAEAPKAPCPGSSAIGAPVPDATLASGGAMSVPVQGGDAFGAPVTQDQLDDLRGGAGGVTNEARLNGYVTANTALNVATGSNTIDGAAFANAAGVPIVIQNTGANVLIQNATIINLQLR